MKELLLLSLVVAASSLPLAQAHDGGGWGGHGPAPYYSPHYVPHGRYMHSLPDGFTRLFIGGLEYFYWEGMYYRMATGGYLVVPAPVGAVVTAIPTGYQHVVVDGVPYYIINGVTYMQTAYGYYQVVPTPRVLLENNAVPVQPVTVNAPINSGDTFTINIPKAQGGYTPISLKRSGNGFIGPQGEFYTEFPRVEQLKLMYGK